MSIGGEYGILLPKITKELIAKEKFTWPPVTAEDIKDVKRFGLGMHMVTTVETTARRIPENLITGETKT